MREPLLKDKNVLVVEDNGINQLVAKQMLAALKATVDIAPDGLEAVEKVQAKKYDLILMDVQMPGMDGYETTRYIRSQLKNDVPIIAMTAFAFKGEVEKCLESGMNEYLAKPFSLESLVAIIEKTLTTVNEESNPHVFTKEGVAVDVSMLYEVAGDDIAYINTMVSTFLENMPPAINKIETAFAEGDHDSLYKAAHYAKSSFSVIKISDVFTYVQDIERVAKQKLDLNTLPPLIKYVKEKFAIAEKVLLERFGTAA